MKTFICLFILMLLFSGVLLSKKKSHKAFRQAKDFSNTHVSDLMQFNPQVRDRSYLWSNFDEPNYNVVSYNGFHGNSWTPPKGNPDSDNGYTHVASPKPPAPKGLNRIIAGDLPANTMSASIHDIPPRKNVLQIDIPSSQTHTTTYSYTTGLGNQPTTRRSFHGINTVQPMILHGRFQEVYPKKVKKATQDALDTAKKVEITAAKLTEGMPNDAANLIIPINVTNKRETLTVAKKLN